MAFNCAASSTEFAAAAGGGINIPATLAYYECMTLRTAPISCRREFLKTAALGLTSCTLARGPIAGQVLAAAEPAIKTGAPPGLAPLNRFPRMMQEWLVRQVRDIEARGNIQRAALKSKADAEAYV